MLSHLHALVPLLTTLPGVDTTAISNDLAAALAEAAHTHPDRTRIGQILDRVLEAAKASPAFTPLVPVLEPHINALVAVLGRDWAHLAGTLDSKAIGLASPIEVVPYDPAWPAAYEAEAAFLRTTLGGDLVRRTAHFGSTAVPGLAAKPVIDILVEIPSFDLVETRIEPVLKPLAYGCMWASATPPAHYMAVKGYGLAVGRPGDDAPLKHHLHMAPADHPVWDRLFFRDHLRTHPEAAAEYAALKYALAIQHRHDREAYTRAKGPFIQSIMIHHARSV